jgi:hypothetical protein
MSGRLGREAGTDEVIRQFFCGSMALEKVPKDNFSHGCIKPDSVRAFGGDRVAAVVSASSVLIDSPMFA